MDPYLSLQTCCGYDLPGLAEVTRQCEGNGLWFGFSSDSGKKGWDGSRVARGASWHHDAPCVYFLHRKIMKNLFGVVGVTHHQFAFGCKSKSCWESMHNDRH